MPTALVQPATQFNFTITLWDAPQDASAESVVTGLATGLLDVGGQLLFGAFSEVQGLQQDIEVETYQEGGLNNRPHRFFKAAKYQNLTFKRGVTLNTSIADWHAQVVTGTKKVRKSGMVMLMDRGGPNLTGFALPGLDRLPVAAWIFSNGLPERIQGPTLNAKSNEIAIESMEISHEGLSRVSLSMIPGFTDINSAIQGAAALGASGVAAVGAALV